MVVATLQGASKWQAVSPLSSLLLDRSASVPISLSFGRLQRFSKQLSSATQKSCASEKARTNPNSALKKAAHRQRLRAISATDSSVLSPSEVTAMAANEMVPSLTGDIIKSAEDKKLYRRLVLDNGLTVVLIHDPEMAEKLAEPAVDSNGQSLDESEEDESDEDEDGEFADNAVVCSST